MCLLIATKLLAVKDSAVEKKPKFSKTIFLSCGLSASLDFHCAISPCFFISTSSGTQLLAIPFL
jgi:hypothetical protein